MMKVYIINPLYTSVYVVVIFATAVVSAPLRVFTASNGKTYANAEYELVYGGDKSLYVAENTLAGLKSYRKLNENEKPKIQEEINRIELLEKQRRMEQNKIRDAQRLENDLKRKKEFRLREELNNRFEDNIRDVQGENEGNERIKSLYQTPISMYENEEKLENYAAESKINQKLPERENEIVRKQGEEKLQIPEVKKRSNQRNRGLKRIGSDLGKENTPQYQENKWDMKQNNHKEEVENYVPESKINQKLPEKENEIVRKQGEEKLQIPEVKKRPNQRNRSLKRIRSDLGKEDTPPYQENKENKWDMEQKTIDAEGLEEDLNREKQWRLLEEQWEREERQREAERLEEYLNREKQWRLLEEQWEREERQREAERREDDLNREKEWGLQEEQLQKKDRQRDNYFQMLNLKRERKQQKREEDLEARLQKREADKTKRNLKHENKLQLREKQLEMEEKKRYAKQLDNKLKRENAPHLRWRKDERQRDKNSQVDYWKIQRDQIEQEDSDQQ